MIDFLLNITYNKTTRNASYQVQQKVGVCMNTIITIGRQYGSGGVFRSRHADLYGISEKREAEARCAKEEIVRLQSVRLRFRGRRTAARLHLSDMQARRVGV